MCLCMIPNGIESSIYPVVTNPWVDVSCAFPLSQLVLVSIIVGLLVPGPYSWLPLVPLIGVHYSYMMSVWPCIQNMCLNFVLLGQLILEELRYFSFVLYFTLAEISLNK